MLEHWESSQGLVAQSLSWVGRSRLQERVGLTGCIAAMGGTYEFTRFASANLREKDDAYNTAIGGFLAGSVLGLKCRLLWQLSFSVNTDVE